jgi:hypothetical protein
MHNEFVTCYAYLDMEIIFYCLTLLNSLGIVVLTDAILFFFFGARAPI